MEATPLAHVVVFPVATKLAVDVMVSPLRGLLMMTLAKEGTASKTVMRRGEEIQFISLPFSRLFQFGTKANEVTNK